MTMRLTPVPDGVTLLIVDDEDIIRSVAKSLLQRKGYRVLVARNGEEALQLVRDEGNQIGLVLLDLTMPHMSGSETLCQLYRLKPDLKVVLMSGYNVQEAAVRSAGQPIAGFVQKPFEAKELFEVIRRALEGPSAT
jgi:two-component system, cell cycle sensor histidine kinase and response regulator CckA